MIQELKLKQGEREIHLKVIRSARKSIGLEVRGEETVYVRIPAGLPDPELKRFIEERRQWIFEKTSLVQKRKDNRVETGATPPEALSPEEIRKITERFSSRVQYYSRRMGVTVGRITIRNQKTRWGSCSAKGNLNFNYQLYYLPEELLDYVVVHELAHRRYMNHSEAFWNEVEKYCPSYRQCRERLKIYKIS